MRVHPSNKIARFNKTLFVFIFSLCCVLSSLAQSPCCSSVCVNDGFENTAPGSYTTGTAVAGWSISSQTFSSCATSSIWVSGSPEFSIVATPLIDPIIGIIGNSPLGGNRVAKLNNNIAGNLRTRLSQTFSASGINHVFKIAYAGVWQQSNHTCCEQAAFNVTFKDCTGNIINCHTINLAPGSSSCGGVQDYTLSNGVYWTNWRIKTIGIPAFSASCGVIEISNSDCAHGDHFGSVLLDVSCSNSQAYQPSSPSWSMGLTWHSYHPPQPGVSYCQGSNIAQICAPLGYNTYSWVAPSFGPPIAPAQATLQCLTINNPFPNSTYTIYLSTISGCLYLGTYVLAASQVSISAVASIPSCSLGTSGAAHVVAIGSGGGYNYTWLNSTNSVVSTASLATNLSSGVYSVIVSAIGSANCGTAMATTTVGAVNSTRRNIIQPYCDANAYLTVNGGSNIQWSYYVNSSSLSPISSASSLTISSPVNGSSYLMTRTSPQGCNDSAIYTLHQSPPTSVTILSNKTICAGATNGEVVFKLNSLTPSLGTNYFIVNSTGTASPYTSSINPTSSNQYTASNLEANGTYTIQAFDGACNYSSGFTVTPIVFDFTIQPNGSQTLCPGNGILKSIQFPPNVSANAFTYSWSPNVFLSGNVNTFSSTVISPVVTVGNQTTVVYSVLITPKVANCPITKTFSLSSVIPVQPSITSIPELCRNAPPYLITASPSGGTFSGYGIIGNSVIPSMLNDGVHLATYVFNTHTCSAVSTSTYLIKQNPIINVSGKDQICNGEMMTLAADGATSYTWSVGANSSIASFTLPFFGTHSLTIAGTGTNGCITHKEFTVSIVQIPTLSLIGNTQICSGTSATLNVNGASQYSWSTGSQSANVVLSPSVSTNYTVQGFSNVNCTASKTVAIIVKNTPTLGISNGQTICAGDQVAISVVGADTYLWNTKDTTNYILASPQSTYVYTVVGTSQGCSAVKTVAVYVIKCTDLLSNEIDSQNELVFPNPGSGLFFLNLNSASDVSVSNSLGQIIHASKTPKEYHTIDLSGFADGIYTLTIFESKEKRTVKLVKKQ